MLKGDAVDAVACFQSLTTRRQWQFDQVHLLFFNAFNFFNAFQRFLMRSTSPFKSLTAFLNVCNNLIQKFISLFWKLCQILQSLQSFAATISSSHQSREASGDFVTDEAIAMAPSRAVLFIWHLNIILKADMPIPHGYDISSISISFKILSLSSGDSKSTLCGQMWVRRRWSRWCERRQRDEKFAAKESYDVPSSSEIDWMIVWKNCQMIYIQYCVLLGHLLRGKKVLQTSL